MIDYKVMLNFLEIVFLMKVGLFQCELEILKFWNDIGLYQKLWVIGGDCLKFVLYDGFLYVNGSIYIGYVVNKIFKDIIVCFKILVGYDVFYVLGWDCYGLFIEYKVEIIYGKNFLVDKICELCCEYVVEQIEGQKVDFICLGVFGEWDNFYKIMNFVNEVNEICVFVEMVKQDFVFKGLKLVNWCFDCGLVLVEVEVEYVDKKLLIIDVGFLVVDVDKLVVVFGLVVLDKLVQIVIWIIMFWIILVNQVLNVYLEIDYVLVDVGDCYLVLVEVLVEFCLVCYQCEGKVVVIVKGEVLELINFCYLFYECLLLVYLVDYVVFDVGIGIVYLLLVYGEDDFYICKCYGMSNDDIFSLVQSNGVYVDLLLFFGGQFIWKVNFNVVVKLEEVGSLLVYEIINYSYMYCWWYKMLLIYCVIVQWFVGMDKQFRQGVFLCE